MKKIQKRMYYLFVLGVFLCESCTTTKTIFVPPLKKEPTVYQIYQVVLDTFQDLAVPVEFQDPPYSLETSWIYWPPSTYNKILGFPLTWWKYRVITSEKTIILEAKGRGFSLTTLFLVNFIPAPVSWISKMLEENLKALDIKIETRIIFN